MPGALMHCGSPAARTHGLHACDANRLELERAAAGAAFCANPRARAVSPAPTKGHHAAEAADVGVELLDALHQLIAGVDVDTRVLVAQALGAWRRRPAAAPPLLLPPHCRRWPRSRCHTGSGTAAAARALHAGRLTGAQRAHACCLYAGAARTRRWTRAHAGSATSRSWGGAGG